MLIANIPKWYKGEENHIIMTFVVYSSIIYKMERFWPKKNWGPAYLIYARIPKIEISVLLFSLRLLKIKYTQFLLQATLIKQLFVNYLVGNLIGCL